MNNTGKIVAKLLCGGFFIFWIAVHPLAAQPDSAHKSIEKLEIDTPSIYTRLRELQNREDTNYSTALNLEMSRLYLLLGDAPSARNVLFTVEEREPGLYQSAKSLARAYDLLEMYDSAYYWIGKAMKADPKAHEASDWIYRHYLTIKAAQQKNLGYILGPSALSLDFGEKDLPENPYNFETAGLKKQLVYQLSDLMYFNPAPNILIGNMLFDLGNIAALNDNLNEAYRYYTMAENYGFDMPLLQARKERIAEMDEEEKNMKSSNFEAEEITSGKLNPYIIGSIVAVFVVVIAWFVMRRRRKAY